MLWANVWGKAGACIDFPSRAVKLGKEVVSFRAITESCAALVQETEVVKASAHLPRTIWLPPGSRTDAVCCLSNVPESIAVGHLFEATPNTPGLWGMTAKRFLPNSITSVAWHATLGWIATMRIENPTRQDRVFHKGMEVAELEAHNLGGSDSDVRDPLDFEISNGEEIVLAAVIEARLPARNESPRHRVHPLGDIDLITKPETVTRLLMTTRGDTKGYSLE